MASHWVLPEELRQLAESGETGLIEEVLSVFQSDTSERLAKLRSALEANDRTEVRRQAHAIKGSSSQVGAASLAALCHQIEDQAATGQESEIAALLARADSAFADVARSMTAAGRFSL